MGVGKKRRVGVGHVHHAPRFHPQLRTPEAVGTTAQATEETGKGEKCSGESKAAVLGRLGLWKNSRSTKKPRNWRTRNATRAQPSQGVRCVLFYCFAFSGTCQARSPARRSSASARACGSRRRGSASRWALERAAALGSPASSSRAASLDCSPGHAHTRACMGHKPREIRGAREAVNMVAPI